MSEQEQRPTDQPSDDAAAPAARRVPGEPHPYVEERRPPNLWLLVIMTAIALVVAIAVMVLTLL